MRQKKMHAGAAKLLFERAKAMRAQPTNAESLLWQYLKQNPYGLKWRRQHPYSLYILDFYCHQLKLVIEVDGSIHYIEENTIADREREKVLEKDGLTVLRFTNNEILHHLDMVMDKLQSYCKTFNK